MKEIRAKRIKDITGKTFGKLTVLNLHHRNERGKVFYMCQCACGRQAIVCRCNLLRGITKSCGCFKDEELKRLHFQGIGELHGKFFNHIAYHAKRRNLPFEITCQQAWDKFIQQGRQCALTGEPIHFKQYTSKGEQTASLDRIDSSKGYTVNNIQWIHKTVNKMKMSLPESVFFDWIVKIFFHKSLDKIIKKS